MGVVFGDKRAKTLIDKEKKLKRIQEVWANHSPIEGLEEDLVENPYAPDEYKDLVREMIKVIR